MKTTIVLLLCLFVSACATGPSPQETQQIIDRTHYGPPPQNYRESIVAYLRGTLIDPDSGQYSNWRGPAKAFVRHFDTGEYIFGHKVCVDVNAKNRMGGYEGRRPYLFVFSSEVIIYAAGGRTRGEYAMAVFKECNF